MPQKNELNLKFLERSLQQLESTRKSFFRDLKIAAIVLLSFQFFIFFPFTHLHREKLRLNPKIEKLSDDKKVINEAQIQLELLKNTLQKGKKEVTEKLKELPHSLRKQLNILNDNLEVYIEDLKKEASDESRLSSPSAASEDIGSLVLQQSTEPSKPTPAGTDSESSHDDIYEKFKLWFNSLSDPKEIIREANFKKPNFNTLVKSFVNDRIIPDLFDDLNSIKNNLVEKPFTSEKQRLLDILQSHGSVFKQHRVEINEIIKSVDKVEMDFQKLEISASLPENWWQTFSGKEEVAKALGVDVNKSIKSFEGALGKPQKELSSLGNELTNIITNTEDRVTEINNDIKDLNNRLEGIKPLLQNFTSPIPFIALRVEEAVLYYPVGLGAIFAYFVWGYVQLHRRARTMAEGYRAHGLSEEVLQFYFSDLLGLKKVTGGIVILWAAPGIFEAINYYLILSRPSVVSISLLFFYAIAGAAFVVTYIIFAVYVLLPTKGTGLR